MKGLVLLSFVSVASGADPCCKACVAPLVKYYSVDVPHGFCGETCIKPSRFSIFKIFEKNLTLSDSDTPCSEQFTPVGTHYTEYSDTVTHGVPGLLAVTLDLYGPGATVPAAAADASIPTTMRAAMVTTPSCSAPDFECINTVQTSVPEPKQGQALVQVAAASVNPSDYKQLEACAPNCQKRGVLGGDVAGTVVQCPGCTRLKVGDVVWGSGQGSLAEFVTAYEASLGLAPKKMNLTEAATLPEVALSDLVCLRTASAPWTGRKNLTVAITSGSGGTGFFGIQLAKAYGATRVVTSTSKANFEFVKSLGADEVVDYHDQDIFDYLSDDSVDIVYDNFGKAGTGDKAMHAIRTGGAYVMLPNGDGNCFSSQSQKYPCVAAHPKEGVANINVITGNFFKDPSQVLAALNEMKGFIDAGQIEARVMQQFSLEDTRAAYAKVAKGHVNGKVAVVVQSGTIVV